MNYAKIGLGIGISSLLLCAAPAEAKRPGAKAKLNGHEASLELGTFGAPDPAWSFFSESSAVSSYGVRLGYGLDERWSIVGSWSRAASGVSTEGWTDDSDDAASHYDDESSHYYDEGEYYDDDPYGSLFQTAFISHQFTVGPKLRWEWKRWLAPYAAAQAVGWLGRARLDDNTSRDDNPNQYRYTGFAAGGMFTGGLDFRFLRVGDHIRLGSHIEAGYGITSRMTLTQDGGTDRANEDGDRAAELGKVGFRGFALRWGVGIRF